MDENHGGAAIPAFVGNGVGMPTALLAPPGARAVVARTSIGSQRREAERLTYALGIPLYLRDDGQIAQFPPGERIEPPPAALPTPHTCKPQAAARV
jgi:hypothetical protein